MGPLDGLKVVELAAVGPGPHAGMYLADLGADIVRIDRPGGEQIGRPDASDPMLRGRRRVDADLKTDEGRATLRALVEHADVVLEGYRPGVVERLGVGPDELLAVNPRLVYARATGWGREGPLADRGGHDLNYLSLTGALHALGAADACPPPPLNMVGDYGGGSMLLLTGVLAGLWHAARTGRGQVVDAAMIDGVVGLSQKVWSLLAQDRWVDARESNVIDGHAPYYRTYRCADGGFMAVAAIERKFYAQLLDGLGLDSADVPDRDDRHAWGRLAARFEDVFATRTRPEWEAVFADLDACTTPVLSWSEAPHHPQIAARGSIVHAHGAHQAGPAPRFSATPPALPAPMADPIPLDHVLAGWAP
ncbi:CaiB/BaiF CoA transferase family protein [Actinomycetospora sp. C-140]